MDIITSIATSPSKLMLVFIGNVMLTDNFQYHSQFVDTDNIAQWDQRKWRHTERWFPVSQSVGWYWQYRSVRSKDRSVRSKENQWDQRKTSEIKGSLSEIKGKLSKWTIILFFNGCGNIWSSEPSGFSCYFLFRFMTLEILHCYAPSRIVVENGGLVVIL